MPKIIAHALVGASIVAAICPIDQLNNQVILFGAAAAIGPDLDLLIERGLNIPDFHRGLTHSLLFSFLVAIIIHFSLGIENQPLAAALSLAFFSHVLLDLFASTTGGVKLWHPFSHRYYHLGLTSALEFPFGSNPKEILKWIIVETIVFLPLFLIVLSLKNR